MTSTTLTRTLPTKLDANGNGTIILKPDVGQNWAPLFVRVSTQSRAVPIAYCAVYHGSPGVPVQQSQFIDDTFLGSGDTSSMISGTPILYGEAIIFSFQNGTPGDTAIATVYGMQSNLPPNLDLVPQVPGTHFAGHPSTEISTQASFVPTNSPTVVPPNTSLFLQAAGSISQPDDVRQYQSYYIKIYATAHNAAATAFNTSRLDLLFYGSSNTSNGTLVFADMAEWWSDNAGGGTFFNINGPLTGQDVMHGPYLVIQYTNQSATDSMDVNYIVEYTTRQLPGPYYRQQDGIDGIVALTGNTPTAINTTINIPTPYLYGRAQQFIHCLGPGSITVNQFYGSLSNVAIQDVVASGATVSRETITPKRAVLFQVMTGGTASGYSIEMISQFDKV